MRRWSMALARRIVGHEVEISVHANGAYRKQQVVRIAHGLAGAWGVSWSDEPVSSDDLAGLWEVSPSAATRATGSG